MCSCPTLWNRPLRVQRLYRHHQALRWSSSWSSWGESVWQVANSLTTHLHARATYDCVLDVSVHFDLWRNNHEPFRSPVRLGELESYKNTMLRLNVWRKSCLRSCKVLLCMTCVCRGFCMKNLQNCLESPLYGHGSIYFTEHDQLYWFTVMMTNLGLFPTYT